MTYAEKLLDPRWQKRRTDLLTAANWSCEECGNKEETFHVHHGYYRRNTAPWDYPDEVMHVLCKTCHDEVHMFMAEAHRHLGMLRKTKDVDDVAALLEALSHFPSQRSTLLRLFKEIVDTMVELDVHPKDGQSRYQWLVSGIVDTITLRAFKRGMQLEAEGELTP